MTSKTELEVYKEDGIRERNTKFTEGSSGTNGPFTEGLVGSRLVVLCGERNTSEKMEKSGENLSTNEEGKQY